MTIENLDLQILVLAAGKGTRMKSARSKVLHEILGFTMIERVVARGLDVGAKRVVVINGHCANEVKRCLRPFGERVAFATQEEARGTGHAVWCARHYLDAAAPKFTMILSGDVPNLSSNNLRAFAESFLESGKKVGVMTALLDDAAAYGRVVRRANGDFDRIVEFSDADENVRKIKEINAGTYIAPTAFYYEVLSQYCSRPPQNAQNEWYLPIIVDRAAEDLSSGVYGWCIPCSDQIQGVNTRVDLASAIAYARKVRNEALMLSGVTLLDPATTYIDDDVVIGADTEIGPNVTIKRGTVIGAGVRIEVGCSIARTQIADRAHIKPHSVLEDAFVGEEAAIGPFAHLRPGAEIGTMCKVGNFVEVKKTTMAAGSKASHLTYLGDCEVGENVNIGAGTITCNYDGYNKFRTVIGSGAFIGSNTALIAPVSVGAGALIAAGSAISKDVEADALGIERSEQRSLSGWAARRRKKMDG